MPKLHIATCLILVLKTFCVHASGIHFKEIGLEEAVTNSTFIIQAEYVSEDKDDCGPHSRYAVQKVIYSNTKCTNVNLKVWAAHADVWGIAMAEAEKTGRHLWFTVPEYRGKGSQDKPEKGKSYILLLKPLSRETDFAFYAAGGLLNTNMLQEITKVIEKNNLEKTSIKKTRHDMYEVLLRHFFENNGSGLQGPRPLPDYWDIYIGINDIQFANEDDLILRHPYGLAAIKSPDSEFMKRFANDGRKISAAPEGDTARKLADQYNIGRTEQGTKKQTFIIFMIDGSSKHENGTVIVMAEYFVHSLNSGTYRYTMAFKNGKWIVQDATCISIS
jgi:hypothetical protein